MVPLERVAICQYLLNRNNEVKEIPNLNYTYGNRNDKKDFTTLLVYLSKKVGITEESGKKWDCVIDFCAYQRSHVKV